MLNGATAGSAGGCAVATIGAVADAVVGAGLEGGAAVVVVVAGDAVRGAAPSGAVRCAAGVGGPWSASIPWTDAAGPGCDEAKIDAPPKKAR